MNHLLTAGCLLLVWLPPSNATAAEPSISFAEDVLPLLKKRCATCHGPLKAEAKLILSSPRHIAQGNKEGPVIVAGNLEKSRLWIAVRDDEMPVDEPLSDEEKQLLRDWIASGAVGLSARVAGDELFGHRTCFPSLRKRAIGTTSEWVANQQAGHTTGR